MSPMKIPIQIEPSPINIFSINNNFLNCLIDIPCIINMPNSFLRVFKNELTEYKIKKNENTKIKPCEIVNPIVPYALIVALVDFNSPCKSG